MFGEHHDLVHEFPEYRQQIHHLKLVNQHFSRLFDEYHEVDKEIRRIGQQLETPSDAHFESLKVKRLRLKDELYEMLRQDANATLYSQGERC